MTQDYLKIIILGVLFSSCTKREESRNFVLNDPTFLNYVVQIDKGLSRKELGEIQCIVDGPRYHAGVKLFLKNEKDSIVSYEDFGSAIKQGNRINIHLGGCYGGLVGDYIEISIIDSTYFIDHTNWTDVGDRIYRPVKQSLVLNSSKFDFNENIYGEFEFEGLSHFESYGNEAHLSSRSSYRGYFEVSILGDTTFEHRQIPEDPTEFPFVRKYTADNYSEVDINQIVKLERLEELDLRFKKVGFLPPEFGNLRNLKVLNLMQNNLTNLPAEFANLKNLEELSLRRNQLISYHLLKDLSKLRELNLAQTGIRNIPDEILQLRELRVLDLDGFKPANLNSEIRKLKTLPKLKELGLRYCELHSLPESLRELPALKTVQLNQNPLTDEELNEIKCNFPNLEIKFRKM